jgi:serine/threonine protein phosphatase PrpC
MGCGGSKSESAGGGAPAKPAAPPTPSLLERPAPSALVAGVHSDPGFGADEEDNQDVPLAPTPLGEAGRSLVGLFDGHGDAGRQIALQCREQVAQALTQALADGARPVDAMRAVFKQLHASALASSDINVTESGTSATLALHDHCQRKLFVANVGDSKAVIGTARDGACRTWQLTEDHYPGSKHERERIQAAGGRVAAKDDVQLGELGELRVWKGQSDKPGLAYSRSIGDALAKEVGVTEDPSTKAVSLAAEDRFVVIASAGVWKVCSPQEVVALVAAKASASEAAAAIIEEAKERWAQLWQGAPRPLPPALAIRAARHQRPPRPRAASPRRRREHDGGGPRAPVRSGELAALTGVGPHAERMTVSSLCSARYTP